MVITKEKFGKFEGKWVAFDKKNEEVLASGKDMLSVSKKINKKSFKGLLFMYIVPFNTYLAPTSFV